MAEEDVTSVQTAQDKEIEEGKIFALIGYITILCLVPLLLKKENRFALFHGKQGLVLFIGEVAAAIISIVPILGWIIGVFSFVTFGLLSLTGIVQVLMGQCWKMPVISKVADKISI